MKIALCIATLILSANAMGELIVSAPPIRPKIDMERSFRPLIRSLGKALDEKIRYAHADSWLAYSRDVRADTYDIMLSEAHILALSLLYQNSGGLAHVPLTAMAGKKQLYLVSNTLKISTAKQLAHKNICVKPSPSIDSVLLYRLYSNPISQPNPIEIRGTYNDINLAMQSGKCIAMVTNSKPENTEQNILYSFDAVPQIGWTMTSKLHPKTQEALYNFFNAEENKALINTVFQTVSESPTPPMSLTFQAGDYKGLDKLLTQVWGW